MGLCFGRLYPLLHQLWKLLLHPRPARWNLGDRRAVDGRCQSSVRRESLIHYSPSRMATTTASYLDGNACWLGDQLKSGRSFCWTDQKTLGKRTFTFFVKRLKGENLKGYCRFESIDPMAMFQKKPLRLPLFKINPERASQNLRAS